MTLKCDTALADLERRRTAPASTPDLMTLVNEFGAAMFDCGEWTGDHPEPYHHHADKAGELRTTVASESRRLTTERDEARALLKWLVDETGDGVDSDDGSFRAPEHDCGFVSRPDLGHCKWCAQWTACLSALGYFAPPAPPSSETGR